MATSITIPISLRVVMTDTTVCHKKGSDHAFF